MSYKEESELYDIIEGFQMFGSNNNGVINPNELKEIMETMNIKTQNPFLYNIINKLCLYCNQNNKDGIEPGDFISLLDQELDDTNSIEGLQKIFTALSNPISNKISLHNISNIYKNYENDDNINNIISRPEINGKEINFNEFMDIMKIEEDNSNKEKIYKKKISKGIKRENNINKNKSENENAIKINFNNNYNLDNLDNDKNNFIGTNNEIKKVEINFSNKLINNNNSNYNSTNNLNNSMNSTEKMENIYSSGNKSSRSVNEPNNNLKNNAEINNDIYNLDNNCKNLNNKDEPKEGEGEVEIKKKYYFSKKNQSENIEEGIKPKKLFDKNYEINAENNVNENDKNHKITIKRYHRRYRENKKNIQDKNEEKYE